MKYTEIKSVEDAFKALGRDVNALPDFSMIPEKHQKALMSHYKLVTVIEALNGDWKADYADHNQPKYELWLEVIEDKSKPSGFGLAFDGTVIWRTFTHVGSRLCFATRAIAKYAFDTFRELFEDYYIG